MILVLGDGGQVSNALKAELGSRGRNVPMTEADFTKPETVVASLERYRPRAVINAAAYTAVDQAEKEIEAARLINAESPAAAAEWCAKTGVPFVHYSTDYVYGGAGDAPFTEEEPTGPLGAYGRTKLAGDEAIARAGGPHLILRTSWVYDAYGKNFVRTMLKLGREREALKVVGDQVGGPTYAPHLARLTVQMLDRAMAMGASTQSAGFPSGVYHACNTGYVSWHGFAQAIFDEARARGFRLALRDLLAIPSSEYPTPARRPTNSRLSMEKMKRIFGLEMPHWRRGLQECFELLRDEG